MSKFFEMCFYVSVTAGMAMGTSSFLMLAGAFEVLSAPFVVAAILAAALFCVAISSAIAELATMFPTAPGVRTYLRAAFGDRASLFFVFMYLVFLVLVAAAESNMFALVVTQVLPSVRPNVASLGIIGVVVGINCLGLAPSRGAQIATTALLAAVTLAIGICAYALGPASAVAPPTAQRSDLAAFPGAVGMCVFLFIGFEWVTSMGFRPTAYARRIPWSMPLGIALNALLYGVFVLGASQRLSGDELAASPIPHVPVAAHVFGGWGIYLALALSVGASFSTFNAGLMGGSRLLYGLAREGRLPRVLAWFSVGSGVPLGGVLVLGLLASVGTVIVQALNAQLLVAVVGSALVCAVYAAMLLAARRLRNSPHASRRTFHSPLGAAALVALALALVGIGLASLVAQPALAASATMCTALSVLLAFGLSRWSAQHAETLQPRTQPERAT